MSKYKKHKEIKKQVNYLLSLEERRKQIEDRFNFRKSLLTNS